MCAPLTLLHYKRRLRFTDRSGHTCLSFFLYVSVWISCIRHRETSPVCLLRVGCEKRQRLGESCRETLQGLEKMLIKASYSTASSFLTVPAAGSTTLCFLTTSSPLYLSALLYFCLPLSLSSLPRLRLTCFPSLRSVLHLPCEKLKRQMFACAD